MDELFTSGRAVDIALAVMAFEAVWLLRSARQRQRPPFDLLFNLLSGACLLFALRAALTSAHWGFVAAALTAAFAAHLFALFARGVETLPPQTDFRRSLR